uniref:hematopoietic prostaglandin D synthase-like n=1 Tax=Myxine glutinosa TaxID=7769 RepID=UPI00358F922A
MASTYKLVYFNGRGRAELPRLVLAQAGIRYTDRRIEIEEWKDLKPDMPFGQLPVLYVNGAVLHQSLTIARFLAFETGLAGKTSMEQAQACSIVESIHDLVMIGPRFRNSEEVKKQKEKDLFEALPTFINYMERFLGDREWMVGTSVTWADLCLQNFVLWLKELRPEALKTSPKLQAVCNRVEALPNIAAWLKNRPQTMF